VVATVTGGTWVGGAYYSDAARVSVSGGAGSVGITLVGNTITTTTSQSVVNNSTATQPVNAVSIDNPLLTTSPMVSNVLGWVAAECQGVYLYEVDSWMDPSLECGDVVFWDSQYATNTKQAKIIRQEFRFDGTLSGTINGKGLGGTYTPASPDSSGGSSISGSGSNGGTWVDYLNALYAPITTFSFTKQYTTAPVAMATLVFDYGTVGTEDLSFMNTYSMFPCVELIVSLVGGSLTYTGARVHWQGTNVPATLVNAKVALSVIGGA